MRVAVTGGVGSGKSTVAAMLADHGAVVVDADAIAREVVMPGTAGLTAVVAAFGPGVLAEDGSLDRPRLAELVFKDGDALSELNRIVHPLVAARSAELMAQAPADAVLVYDVPLLAEGGRRSDFDFVIVVETPLALRFSRLEARGMGREQAEARMAQQATDDQRRAIADEVIVNDGSLEQLRASVDALWPRLLPQ